MFVSINQNDKAIRIQVVEPEIMYAVAKEIEISSDNPVRSISVLKQIIALAFHLRLRIIIEKQREKTSSFWLTIKDFIYCRMFGKVL